MHRIALPLVNLGLILGACSGGDPGPSPPPAPPPGTVLTVNGEPILAEEVDRFARPIAELEPQFLLLHHRRLALTNVVLPAAALRTLDPHAHAQARAESASTLELGNDELVARSSGVEGTFRELGLDLWCLARGLPRGEWRGPLELVGRLAIVRLDGAEGLEEDEVLRLRWIEFPFVGGDLRARIEEAVDRSRLEIVDPAWREAVPEAWLHRMQEKP